MIEVLSEYFSELLKAKKNVIRHVTGEFQRVYKAKDENLNYEKELNAQLHKLQKMRQKYMDMYTDDLITREELNEKIGGTKQEIERLENELKMVAYHLTKGEQLETILNRTFKEIEDISDVHQMTNAQLKRIIQKIEVDKDGNVDIYLRIFGDLGLDETVLISDNQTVGGVSVSNNYDGETVTGKGNFSIMLTGEGPDAKMINNSDMKYGSYFGETEIEEGKNVCVISDTDAKQLFGTDDVVGMSLDITCYDSSKSFRIMGVTTQKENGTFVSYTYDGMPVTVNVPYSSMDDLVGGTDEFYSITVVQADKTLDSQIVADQVVHLLEKRHQCAGEDYFHVQSFQDVLQSMNEMLGMVTAFISFVAGISLLVGGIGVMNIMLVSVTERTREIGIRKSLGAKTSSIMMQFLAEAAILTVMGGVIGIILGILAGYGICSIMSGSMGMTITPGISPTVILAATLFSCAVGVFFGIYPAKKAAKLSPIEALRRN